MSGRTQVKKGLDETNCASITTGPDALNQGKIVSIRGSVVNVWFEQNLPAIYSVLRTDTENPVTIEVETQLDDHTVRGIALTSTQGLARGMRIVPSANGAGG